MSMPKCLFFQDLEGLTEVFGRMSAGTSGRKLPLWADFSFLTQAPSIVKALLRPSRVLLTWRHGTQGRAWPGLSISMPFHGRLFGDLQVAPRTPCEKTFCVPYWNGVLGRGCDEAKNQWRKAPFHWKGSRHSVNEGNGKEFHRKGNSLKRFRWFSESPLQKLKISALIPFPTLHSYPRLVTLLTC